MLIEFVYPTLYPTNTHTHTLLWRPLFLPIVLSVHSVLLCVFCCGVQKELIKRNKLERPLTPQIVEFPGSAVLVDHQVLVKLEGRESDRHLGHNACSNSSQTLVQG